MMNEVEKKAAQMGERRQSFRTFARDNNWLVPCIRFRGVSMDEQMKKIREEVDEVAEAYRKYQETGNATDMRALLMECADVQVCMETLMDNLGAGDIDRTIARHRVFEKNNLRDYYKRKE